MATGGGSKKSAASEPRQRSSWQRTTSMSDKEDNVSLSSMPNDLRPNNWDFSDWRPSSNKDQTKNRKKGNPEWEREQSVSQESPPPSETQRQHGTPRTFPRTKMTPSTPTAQRVALENLRQHITFSDPEDDASNDGERNNERNVFRRRENLPGYTRQDVSSAGENQLTRPVPNKQDRNNRNNNKQNRNETNQTGKPDSSQIVGRLMQIRDYIKQAGSMMDSLRKSGDPPGYRDEMDRLQKLMDHLKEQERGYTGLLQTLLSVREDGGGINDMSRELTANLEPMMDDTQSIDLDVESEMSEREERSISASSRPRIEDKLGLTSDNDEEEEEEAEGAAQSDSSDKSSNMDDTVIAGRKNQEWDFELGEEELTVAGMENPKEAAETLVALKQQQELLTKLIEQQEQMRALRGRQAALLALQQDAETKLQSARQKSNEARANKKRLQEAVGTMSSQADSLMTAESNAERQAPPDSDLQDIRQQLQYLRNELKSQNVQNEDVQPPQPQPSRSNLPASSNTDTRPKKRGPPPPRPPSPKFNEPRVSLSQQEQGGGGAGAGEENTGPWGQMSKEQIQGNLQQLLGTRDKLDKLLKEEFSGGPLLPPSGDMSRDQLQGKLQELQNKKQRMDDMLQELHHLRSNQSALLNNATAAASMAAAGGPTLGGATLASLTQAGSTLASLTQGGPTLASLTQGGPSLGSLTQGGPTPVTRNEEEDDLVQTEGSDNIAAQAVGMLEARQKLQKLNEVKERLSKLKGLVQYYQAFEPGQGAQPDNEDESSLPAYSDYGGDPEAAHETGLKSRQQREVKEADESVQQRGPAQRGGPAQQVNIPVEEVGSGDNNNSSSSSSSDTESQLSSLGPWGDDPEIQEKVSKLKAAKEKLKYLQNLVSMVQHSPDVAGELPDNIAEIAASIEDVESQITQPEDRNNASASDGEIPPQNERESFYQSRMQEQLLELDKLKNEKTHLLTIQSQLQSLHDRFAEEEERRLDDDGGMNVQETRPKSKPSQQQNNQQESVNQQSSGPSVTFSSNEEVYDKMRKQRMLREELRDKKKQLESIMKKDRNKKSYYRNQDNQSDTVSYSTEPFGASASVDATMATWGGSTVDNLESITEDGAADPQDNEEDEDDAYPIDGILQVEEEEEENQSDNETYTIEEDVRQRRKARTLAKSSSPDTNMRGTPGGGKGGKRSFPRPSRQGQPMGGGPEGGGGMRGPKEAWTRPPDFSKWSRSGKSRQENYRSAEDIVDDDEDSPGRQQGQRQTMDELQHKLGEISMMCQSLVGPDQGHGGMLARQTAAGFGSQMLPDLQQQLQQQQLMMSLNQCYQQISMQQMELQNMQRQMQSLVYQGPPGVPGQDLNESGLSADMRVRSMPSLFSPMLSRQSPSLQLDHHVFNQQYPQYPGGFMQGNSRLLRQAVNERDEDAFMAQETVEGSGGGARPKTTRKSRSESYSQKSKAKKSSLSPPVLTQTLLKQKKTEEQMYPDDEENTDKSQERALATQKFEKTLARKQREFLERNKLQGRLSSQQQTESSQRRGMKAKSGEDSPLYRPGLSAGISGAGYAEDGRSVASSVQSSLAAMAQALNNQQASTREQSAGISGAGYAEDGRSVASSVQSSLAAMAIAQALNNQQASTREQRLPSVPQIEAEHRHYPRFVWARLPNTPVRWPVEVKDHAHGDGCLLAYAKCDNALLSIKWSVTIPFPGNVHVLREEGLDILTKKGMKKTMEAFKFDLEWALGSVETSPSKRRRDSSDQDLSPIEDPCSRHQASTPTGEPSSGDQASTPTREPSSGDQTSTPTHKPSSRGKASTHANAKTCVPRLQHPQKTRPKELSRRDKASTPAKAQTCVTRLRHLQKTRPTEPSRRDKASTPRGEPSGIDETSTPTGEPSIGDKASTPTGESSSGHQASTPTGEPSRADKASTPTGESSSGDQASTPTGEPSSADKASTPTGESSSGDQASTPTGEPSSADKASTPTGEPSSGDEASTPTHKPSSRGKSSTPTEDPSSRDCFNQASTSTADVPIDDPYDQVYQPLTDTSSDDSDSDKDVQATIDSVDQTESDSEDQALIDIPGRDKASTPIGEPFSRDKASTPTGEPSSGDEASTPTEEPSSGDEASTPTGEPSSGDEASTPTEEPSSRDEASTPTEDPSSRGKVSTPTEDPSSRDCFNQASTSTADVPIDDPYDQVYQPLTDISSDDSDSDNDVQATIDSVDQTESDSEDQALIDIPGRDKASTPIREPFSRDKASTPTGEPSSGDEASTPTGEPSSADKASTPTGESSSGDQASTPTGEPSSADKASTPTGESSSGDQASTPTGEPSSADKASTPTGEPSSGDETSTPTEDPSSRDQASTPTGEPSSGDEASTPTEDPSSRGKVSTPTEDPSSRDCFNQASTSTADVPIDDPYDQDYQPLTDISSDDSDSDNDVQATIDTSSDVLRDVNMPQIYIRSHRKSDKASHAQKKAKKVGNLRVYDNHHACFVCGKLRMHINTHMKVHKEIPMIKKMLTEEQPDFTKLRKVGDHKHNKKVLKLGKGEIILSRRPEDKLNIALYGPCLSCKEWLLLKNMKRHLEVCTKTKIKLTNRQVIVMSQVEAGVLCSKPSQLMVNEVFPTMLNDEVSEVAKGDVSIVALGESWLRRCIDNKEKRRHYASQHMRLMAKVLIQLRRLDNSTNAFSEYLSPRHFDKIVAAVLECCFPYLEDIEELKSPSNGIKIKYDLRRMLTAAWAMLVKKDPRSSEAKEVQTCRELLNVEWGERITKLARAVMVRRQMTFKQEIPSPEDVHKLSVYVASELKHAALDEDNFQRVVQLAQTRIMLYNKRRSGEVDAIRLESYAGRSRNLDELDQSLVGDLTVVEMHLLKSQDLMRVRGKGNRVVPVLIPEDARSPLDFVSTREVRRRAGIPDKNDYLFPIVGRTEGRQSHARAYSSLKKTCGECSLVAPTRINSVSMRKYTATLTQMLNLDKYQVDWVCKHLGHTKSVHKAHYQQMSDFIERVHITKLLLVQDMNLTKQFKGKKLEDIDVSEIVFPEETTAVHSGRSEVLAESVSKAFLELERDSDDNPNEMSLFETLRETIYSEVATLISQNENRPHYLIELFRELQLLTSDYLRQRVLYDIKDVVSKYLVEENSISAPPPPWMNTAVNNFTASELTPSESIVTSDDEEVKSLLQTKLKECVAANLVARERERQAHTQHQQRQQQQRQTRTTAAALIRSGSLKDDKYDYQEDVAEVESSVSTPSNSNYWDSPFNRDSLGETAINLDKTLEKMREYERKLGERDAKVRAYAEARQTSDTVEASSSAMDQGSESSAASDSVPYPRIDTQQLDQQIKAIMTEVIPVIKEHMENMCSPQLLAYIKRLVLSLTRQYDSGQEFARFFHRQLGSILQDSLAKYEGRKMRECGEDLLVDMSEVLFNELAFFRLMQDLDDPLIAEKMRKAQSQDEKDKDSAEEEDEDNDDEDDDDDDDDDAESDTTESSTANASDNQDDTRPSHVEQEELGKSRDDALASAIEIQDAEDKDESPESLFKGVQIELAPSETKPYTRIGSDEDDESADDESQSNEDPSETAVSINARMVNFGDDNEEDAASRQDGTVPAQTPAAAGAQQDNEETEVKAAAGTGPVVAQQQQQASSGTTTDQGADADQGASSGKLEQPQDTENMNGDINGDMLNGDIEVITMDDLPPSMTIMSQDELQQKVIQEQQTTTGASAVLDTLENKDELAGDPQHLKEPDESSC